MKRLPHRARAALVLAVCCHALPAAAEGGSYPSMGVLVAVGLGYLFLVPLVATALAYGAMKLLRPQKVIRGKRAFAAALLAWIASMLLFNYSSLDRYLSDNAALALGGALVFGIAFGVAYVAPAATPSNTHSL